MHALVLVVDAFPLGLVGCYGNDWVETPAIDRLANEGFVFDLCCAQSPSAGGSLFGALTGRPAWRRELGTASLPLLDSLRAGQVELSFTTDRSDGDVFNNPTSGWDHYEVVRDAPLSEAELPPLDLLLTHPEYRPPAKSDPRFIPWTNRWRRQLIRELETEEGALRTIERVFDSARQWVSSRSDRSSLQWIDLSLIGGQWLPPEEFHGKYFDSKDALPIRDPAPGMVGEMIRPDEMPLVRATIAGRLGYFDQLLGSLLDALKSKGDDVLLILTADSGLPLGEHGLIGPHRPWLYEEREHVPLIVSMPGGRRCVRSPALTATTDLHATLLEYFGLQTMSDIPSRSLIPSLTGKPVAAHDYVVSGLDDDEFAIRTRQWKLIVPMAKESDGRPRARGLFSKPEDRWDHHNLADLHSDVADYLELAVRRHVDAAHRGTLDFLPPLREDVLTQH